MRFLFEEMKQQIFSVDSNHILRKSCCFSFVVLRKQEHVLPSSYLNQHKGVVWITVPNILNVSPSYKT